MTTLEKIKKLQYFNGLKNLKVILEEFFSSVTALETNSVIVGKSTLVLDEQTSGTLIVGKKYVISSLEIGDDFSNVGFIAEDVPFIATATTPTDWSNSTVVSFQSGSVDIFYNDVDLNLEVFVALSGVNSGRLVFNVTNNAFISNKTYPVLEASVAEILNNNELFFNNTTGYFKIEIYN